MRKKISLLLALVISIATFGAGLTLGHSASGIFTRAPVAAVTEPRPDVDLGNFWKLWTMLEQKYVDVGTLTNDKLVYGAMKGLVHSLGDPFSEFLDPEESKEFLSDLEGSLEGIGAEVGIRNNSLVVISPLRGSPAEAAGLRPGDHIFKIDGALSSDFSIVEAVKRIRGAAGTTVKLTIFRDGETEPKEISIVRAQVHVDSVKTEIRDDRIAVVTVATFADTTAIEFAKALHEIANKNTKGLVIDLRYNGGGFLDAAVEMVSDVLGSGDVVLIKERGLPDRVTPVTGNVIVPDLPIVVLINGGSASASEIFAGALQDAKRATIVGEKSFGKGTVQELVREFSDGSTLRVTVAKWFTPAGHDVTKESIQPDVEVKMTAADYDAKRDPQLEKAVAILK